MTITEDFFNTVYFQGKVCFSGATPELHKQQIWQGEMCLTIRMEASCDLKLD